MFSHVMVGSNDIERSKRFYDAVLGVLGAGEPLRNAAPTGHTRLFYRHDGETFCVSEPINGEEATIANGATIGFKAFLLNIPNPKLTISFLAFLPQFVEPGAAQPLAQLLTLSAIFMAMTLAVFVVYGFVAHAFRRYVIESSSVQRWLRYSFAAAFAGLGAKLAASER
jgi:catechol 2,3-dioxygenase-like lactoylglutathione lyase family enzyme